MSLCVATRGGGVLSVFVCGCVCVHVFVRAFVCFHLCMHVEHVLRLN